MALQMCEKLQRYTWPLKVEVTSKAPMNWFMAPLLASTGTLGTFVPLSASSARTTSVYHPSPAVNPASVLECGGLPPLLQLQPCSRLTYFPAHSFSKGDIDFLMQPNPKSHPAVTAAGIVAILFAAVGVLSAILVEISLFAVSRMASTNQGVPFPEAARAMASLTWLFLFLLAIFGIFVGANILRRRNWARISILIWGGLMAFFSAITMAVTLLVMDQLPSVMPHAAEAAPVLAVMKWVLAVFYAIPLGVGIWWLILFTRKAVVEEFNPPLARLHPGKTLDASGFPQEPPPPPSYVPGGPACPLPLLIIAGLDIFSGVSMLTFLFIPYSFISAIPFFVFGHAFHGGLALVFLVLFGVVYAVCGVGIIKLKPWALDPLIWCKALFFLSGVVTFLNPQFMPAMREAIAKMMPTNPEIPVNLWPFSDTYFKSMMAFGFAFALAMLALLIVYRKRYLEAARINNPAAS